MGKGAQDAIVHQATDEVMDLAKTLRLTGPQLQFCLALAENGGNQTQAAIAAGVAGGRAAIQGSRWVRLGKVRAVRAFLTSKATALVERQAEGAIPSLAECLQFLGRVQRTHIAEPFNDDGTVSMEKLRAMPAGVVRKIKVKSTTDAEGQAYAQHEVELESAVVAAQTIIKHHTGEKAQDVARGALADALQALPPEVVAVVARAMLSGRTTPLIDVTAKAIGGARP